MLARREFMRLGLAGAGLSLLAACAPAAPAPAAPTAAPAGAAKPTPAAAPTTAAVPTTAPAAQPAAATPAAASASASTFVMAYTANDPTTMDPAVANESQANIIVLATYEPLVAYVPGTSDISPKLAIEWKLSDDGVTYTFKLRPGVKFQDGAAFDATAVKFSFDRLNLMGKGAAYVLAGIYDRTDVVDDLTVNVVLKTPVGHFLSMLPKVFMVNPSWVNEHATADDKFAEKYLYDHVNGTGAFSVERWDHNTQVVFVKNPTYWGLPARPKLDRAVLRVIPDLASARLLLEKGDLDAWGTGIPLDMLPALKANSSIAVSEDETVTALYVQVSQVKPPLDNLKVRQAIAYAFDYPGFIDGVYQGHAVTAQGPVARGIPFHDSTLPMPTRDVAKAKQLLADAGFPNGGFELEYVAVQGDPPERGAGLVLQENLKELGIKLNIVEQTWPVMVARMQNTDTAQMMHLYGYYRFPPYADPDAYFYLPFHTSQIGKGYNGTSYGNPETDVLIDKGRTAIDPKERESIYKLLQKRLNDDVAALWVANPTAITAMRSWVKGYKYTPAFNQTLNLEEIWLEGKR